MTHLIIGFALLLISLSAGMYLLAKTKKEDLGNFFQAISWVIISLSMAGILVVSVRTIAGGGHEVHKRIEIREDGMRNNMQFMHHGNKNFKRRKHIQQCNETCTENSCSKEMNNEACCKMKMDKKSNCCKKGAQKEEIIIMKEDDKKGTTE